MWTCVRRACAQAGEAHRRAQRASADWRRGGEPGRVRVCLCLPSARPGEGRRCSPTSGRARGRRRAAAAPPRRRARAGCVRRACKYRTYLPRHTRWWQACAPAFPARCARTRGLALRRAHRTRRYAASYLHDRRQTRAIAWWCEVHSRPGALHCVPRACAVTRLRAAPRRRAARARAAAPRAARAASARRRCVPRRPSVRRSSPAPRGGEGTVRACALLRRVEEGKQPFHRRATAGHFSGVAFDRRITTNVGTGWPLRASDARARVLARVDCCAQRTLRSTVGRRSRRRRRREDFWARGSAGGKKSRRLQRRGCVCGGILSHAPWVGLRLCPSLKHPRAPAREVRSW